MTVLLILAAAGLTYLSRAAALVLLPAPPPRLQVVLERVPVPLFAGLAALELAGGGGAPDTASLAAGAGALLLTPTRSLPAILAGGAAGYAVVVLVAR